MKKTDSYMKVIVGVLCGVVAFYLGFSILRSAGASYTTYKAVRYEVGDGISTSGFVVRNEKVLTSDRTIVVLTRGEGERVSAGSSIASSYTDEAARRRQAQIDAMSDELAQMEYAYTYSGSDSSGAALDAEIVQSIQTINTYLARQEFNAAEQSAEQLKSFVLRRYITSADAETLHQRIMKTQAELNALKAQAQFTASEITVDEAGYFSGTADGYEAMLTPDFVENASVADVLQLEKMRPAKPSRAIGRLVLDARWYYITAVDADSLGDCREGDYVTVQFAYDFYQSVQMRVHRLSKPENGKSVVVLTTDRFLQTAVLSRAQSAEIIFSTRSGLRVPKTAIYVNDEGESGVYVRSGARAIWKNVEILFDSGDYFIVREDRSSTEHLWPDDEILLTAEELYDGKVIEP